jgi:ephrin-B
LGGGAAGLPPQTPVVYKGGDRFFPGGSIHHFDHPTGTAAPTHVPPPAIYPAHPHQPQPPIHNGPSSITPPKTSAGPKKKNSMYHVVASSSSFVYLSILVLIDKISF